MDNEDVLSIIIESLNRQGEIKFLEGASDEQIAEFEVENGIQLPKAYKAWLRFSDGGELFTPLWNTDLRSVSWTSNRCWG